ncbi:MAG: hypothetical protein ACSLFQ_17455 [Thermoanaerobaculia bacterium]
MSKGNRLPPDDLDRAIEARSIEIRARQLELPVEKLLEMFRDGSRDSSSRCSSVSRSRRSRRSS